MSVLNEDTLGLMCLVEKNEQLYDDCYRMTTHALENHPPHGSIQKGVGSIAASARAELSGTLPRVIRYSDDTEIQQHLADARIDWRDVAREFIADVLCTEDS